MALKAGRGKSSRASIQAWDCQESLALEDSTLTVLCETEDQGAKPENEED